MMAYPTADSVRHRSELCEEYAGLDAQLTLHSLSQSTLRMYNMSNYCKHGKSKPDDL